PDMNATGIYTCTTHAECDFALRGDLISCQKYITDYSSGIAQLDADIEEADSSGRTSACLT
ncbi:MAG TPA: hypothetical protein VF793_07025, partial [Telluria sp.]